MNKRIQELKHQASQWCDQNIPEQWSEETFGYGEAWEDKFAELIIQECGNALSPMLRDMISRGQAYELLKKHFGVEE